MPTALLTTLLALVAATADAELAADRDYRDTVIPILLADEALTQGLRSYAYSATGYDPFVAPAERLDPAAKQTRPPGLAGMLVGEIRLQGLTLLSDEPIAILMGTDGVGYSVRPGDQLWNGRIVDIDFDRGEILFDERTTDGSVGVRFRRVARRLRPE